MWPSTLQLLRLVALVLPASVELSRTWVFSLAAEVGVTLVAVLCICCVLLLPTKGKSFFQGPMTRELTRNIEWTACCFACIDHLPPAFPCAQLHDRQASLPSSVAPSRPLPS